MTHDSLLASRRFAGLRSVHRWLLGLAGVLLVWSMLGWTRVDSPTSDSSLEGATLTLHQPGRSPRVFRLVPVDPPADAPVAGELPPPPLVAREGRITLIDGERVAPATVHAHAMGFAEVEKSPLSFQIDWDFGDGPASRGSGFNFAHHYTRPGRYTITLRLTDPQGRTSEHVETVEILPDNRRPIYVAAAGDDALDGRTPQQSVRTLARAVRLATHDTRVMLRRGDRFDVDASLRLTGSNLHITAWGDPFAPLPVIHFTGPKQTIALFDITRTARDVVFDSIAFDSVHAKDLEKAGHHDVVRAAGTNLTLRHCEIRNVGYFFNGNGNPTGVLLEDNRATSETAIRSYFAWLQGSDAVVRRNHAPNSTREHVVRVWQTSRLNISDNDFANIARAPEDPRDIIKSAITAQWGTHAYITNNRVSSGPISVGPLGGEDGLRNPQARFEHAVISNNVVQAGLEVHHGASSVRIADNQLTPNDAYAIVVHGYSSRFERGVSDLSIANNHATNNGTQGGFLRVNGRVERIELLDNDFRAPRLSPGSHNTALVYVQGRDLSSFSKIARNRWPLVRPQTFAQGGVFYVWPSWADPQGYWTAQRWLEQDVVKDDRFE